MKNTLHVLMAASLLATAACGGDSSNEEAMPESGGAMMEQPMGSVSIVEPAQGADVMGPDVTVRLQATGVRIVPAGDMTPGTGHHHIYLDADVTDAGVPVPAVPGSIVHMGDASSEFTFENVAPGQHRLIAVVADGAHVPLQPWVVDTVTFTVH